MAIAPVKQLWSIASPSEIERTARGLMELRDRFLSSGPTEAAMARPLIRRSWARCREMHVDAARRFAPLAFTRDAQLAEVRAVNEPLLRAALPVIERLADHLADSGYVIVLADASGCILHLAGDRDVQRRLERIDFVPGGDWSEAAAGTNAIGTAVADCRTVQLMAAEHFCDGWTNLTCTAAPIRDPLSGRVLGVLDITGDYRLIRAHLTNVLGLCALEIGERLRTTARGDLVSTTEPTRHAATARLQAVAEPPSYSDSVLLTLAGGAVTASLDVDVTLRSVAEQTASLLRAQCTAVCLFGTDEAAASRFSRVWLKVSPDIHRTALLDLLETCDAVPHLRERGESIIADDIADIGAFGPSAEIRSIALLPLPTARGIIGFVAAARPAVAVWNFVELRRGFALMSQAATAIENALLFESLREHNRHVEAINAVAQLLGALLEPAQHLDDIVDSIAEVMGCESGALYFTRDQERPAPDLVAHAMLAGEPLLRHGSAYDLVAVPLKDGAATIAVLELRSRRTRSLDAADVATLTAISQQLSMSLKNAQLLRDAGEVDILRRADRLKSEFLATVSHDLRSPLTAIRASIDGLLDRPMRVPTAEDGFLHTIAAQANRLTRLVDQLLDVSQIEAGGLRLDREWNELPALVADAVDGIASLYGSQRIERAIAPDPPLLFVDHDRFIQVLYNLLDNARKHAPSDSPVRIEASWNADTMTIGVADRGPGVNALEREHIFKRFYRGDAPKNEMRSVGLGLAICRGIVEAHGGSIWIEDRPRGGSIFRLTVPLVADPAREPV